MPGIENMAEPCDLPGMVQHWLFIDLTVANQMAEMAGEAQLVMAERMTGLMTGFYRQGHGGF